MHTCIHKQTNIHTYAEIIQALHTEHSDFSDAELLASRYSIPLKICVSVVERRPDMYSRERLRMLDEGSVCGGVSMCVCMYYIYICVCVCVCTYIDVDGYIGCEWLRMLNERSG